MIIKCLEIPFCIFCDITFKNRVCNILLFLNTFINYSFNFNFRTTYYLTRHQVMPNENERNCVEKTSNDINANSTKDMKLNNIDGNLKTS